MTTMLHVTNGDAAAEVIRAAGIPGDILPWRDVLHDGPVPAELPLEALSEVRARFIAGAGWAAADEVARDFHARDAVLAAFRDYDEVVLWFEHDLYDQLQLAQVLDWLSAQDLGATRLTMILGDEYLGPSTPERLAERFPAREEVTDAHLSAAEDAWNAFRSPDPTAIEAFLAADGGALPYLAPALRRHLEQFPSARDGLSRSERQALEEIAEGGASTVAEAYRAHQGREEPIWLGDSSFVDYLLGLAAEETPLIALGEGGEGADAFARTVALTDMGREVLAGRADRVRLNGIDRWLGGVHLRGRDGVWRWDTERGRLTR